MVELSSRMLQAMGFRPMAEGEQICAAFQSLHVYEVRGFELDNGICLSFPGKISGVVYSMALGMSINDLWQALSNNNFTDDEQTWARKQNCTPPYILVKLASATPHSCVNGYVKDDEPDIMTYNCFSSAREELCASQGKVLPSLISALTYRFSSKDKSVRFRSIHKEFFGLTSSGRIVHDERYEMRGSGYLSTHLATDEASTAAENAVALAERLDLKVSGFFNLALQEEDLLKRFLYFFLAIEIETHTVFKKIDHSSHFASLITSPPQVRETSTQFFMAQCKKWTNLKDLFVWCAMCAWPHLTDTDIEEFTRLKKIRDDIAHGSIAGPQGEAVAAVERLAIRLHGQDK